ncbi:MAG: mechanosensitive ion channel [Pirellulales bacterium]
MARCTAAFARFALFAQLAIIWTASMAVAAPTANADSPVSEVSSTSAKGQRPAEASFSQTLEQLTDFSDPTAWWHGTVELVSHKGIELAINLLSAIVIFVVGRWVAKILTRVISRIAVKAKVDETLVKFSTNLSYAAMLAFVVLSSLNRIGIDTTSFTAVVAAAGLAIGFALQGSLSNFAAGVLLIVFKPFKVGDHVLAGGSTGTVEEIQIFNTLIRADNNAQVIVPNSAITGGTITNYSAERVRRVDITFRCSYDNDLRALKRFLVETLQEDDRILQLPPPVVAIDQLADNGVSFVVQPWVRTEYFQAVRTDLLEAIKLGFQAQGFKMAGQAAKPAASAPPSAAAA